ncbi:unnamed protein product [Colias eurytheme]|nr:unnamed protein product [Colias eurytheme]
MSDWSVFDREYADRYDSYPYPYYEDKIQKVPAECAPSPTQDPYAPPPTLTLLLSPPIAKPPCQYEQMVPKGYVHASVMQHCLVFRRNFILEILITCAITQIDPGDKCEVSTLRASYRYT